MIDLSGSIWLGNIAKTHGIKGQVVLRLNNLNPQDILKMETVFIEIDGLPVPFFIKEWEEKGGGSLLITFEDVHDENTARELTTCKVYIPKDELRINADPKSIIDLKFLNGFKVVDKEEGDLGIVKDIVDIEMNPLLRIVDNKNEYYIPFQEEFIIKVDQKKKKLYLKVPPELLNLSSY